MNCPQCDSEGLNIDLDNNQADCDFCGCFWLELDVEEWWIASQDTPEKRSE